MAQQVKMASLSYENMLNGYESLGGDWRC